MALVKRWLRAHGLIFAPYVMLVLVGALGFRGLEQEGHQRCLDRQADRQVLRQVVDISTGSTSAVLDFTKVPGFDDIADPNMQSFLRNLSTQIASTPPSGRLTLHDQLLAQLPPITC